MLTNTKHTMTENLSGSLKPLQNLFVHTINVNVIGWAFQPTALPVALISY
ncbi:MAG: hypothetical protein IJM09_01635 [Neisseriaceae bacterium]|nr:hypothetical protein [Neisseriaceae bacterium]